MALRLHRPPRTHRSRHGPDLLQPRGPLSRSRREGLTAAQAFHEAHGHLDVPTDPVGFELGRFVTAMRDAHNTARLATSPPNSTPSA
ncbi:helicase associated domain-containing protein [Streptomyces sp. NPDC001773]